MNEQVNQENGNVMKELNLFECKDLEIVSEACRIIADILFYYERALYFAKDGYESIADEYIQVVHKKIRRLCHLSEDKVVRG